MSKSERIAAGSVVTLLITGFKSEKNMGAEIQSSPLPGAARARMLRSMIATVQPGSPDNEERRLLAEYQTATRYYSWAVGELSRQRGTLSEDDYDKLHKLAEDALTECEKARSALQELKETQ